MSVVLMYHALYRNEDTSLIDDEDLPYAVSEETFVAQLDAIASKRVGVFGNESVPDIVLTFDDGHKSNLDIAVPLMVERNLSGYFFITTDFMGKRPGFMVEQDLQTLANIPGMIVGSHGVTHQFFDDMTDPVAKQELLDSRDYLETITKQPCQSMSFPGGRYHSNTLKMMSDSGYVQWFGSDVGIVPSTCFSPDRLNSDEAEKALSRMLKMAPLQRIAIRRTTQMDEFERMIGPDPRYYTSLRRRGFAKKLLRRALGNRLYHGLYKLLSAR